MADLINNEPGPQAPAPRGVPGPREGASGHVVVIGGINMDLCGRPAGALLPRDSNPGRVSLRPGGVGRNIAHDLRLLGLDVSLIAALGGDLFAAALRESCRELGLDLSMALTVPELPSGVYLYLTDGEGDLYAAVSDMEATARLLPAALEPHLPALNRADAVVLDANLPEETLLFLAERCAAPLYADPVSAAKAPRLRGLLPRLRALKPNRLEAEALTGRADEEDAVRALLERGTERVCLSLGAEGLLAGEAGQLLRVPPVPVEAVNANGAGDAATAALVWGGVLGLDLKRAAQAAALAGALTAASADTNTPQLRRLPELLGLRETDRPAGADA